MSAPSDPLIGQQLGDYQIEEILGRGGMARVYKGYDTQLDRYAAVKVIDTTLLGTENEEEYRQRFQREARAIAKLNHPNIVGIYQFGEFNDLYYMAMKFIEGRDLGQILTRSGEKFTPSQVLRIIHDIAGALDYAHAGGVIHRDVKPSNIMITPQGGAILTDFGLALSVPEGTMGNTFGSAHYIAPEQAVSSADAVPQSDLYSLGVVLYQLMVGKVPFDDPSAMSVALKHLRDAPVPPRQLNPSILPAVEAVILKTLEKFPENRYQNGEAFARALEQAMGVSTLSDSASLPARQMLPTTTAEVRAVRDPGSAGTINLPLSNISRPDPRPSLALAELDVDTNRGASVAKRISQQMAAAPSQRPPRQRRGMLVMGGIIGLALAIGALVVASRPPENTLSAAALATETLSPPTRAVTQTSPPTSMPSSTPAPPSPTTRATLRPSATSRAIIGGEVDAPTATPVLERDNSVALMYDGNELIIRNQSDDLVNLSGISFVRPAADGQNESSFSVDQLTGGSAPVFALPPGDCFALWRIDLPIQPIDEGCAQRHAWRELGAPRWFWISSREGAQFEVRRSGAVLATCTIAAGTCSFTP
ncbi:MAG: protein kinase [Pleurocapsa minor GSE-CHR-MK-17-07R]|jgi:serine/threonine protein kinase|nr:protein kinase [Pleurocapsa minor GSE-CHR-MK 17-07R]